MTVTGVRYQKGLKLEVKLRTSEGGSEDEADKSKTTLEQNE